MSEYSGATEQAAPKTKPPSPFANELIDVLLRGLGSARDQLRSGEATERGQLCLGWYLDSGPTQCMIWYSVPAAQVPTE